MGCRWVEVAVRMSVLSERPVLHGEAAETELVHQEAELLWEVGVRRGSGDPEAITRDHRSPDRRGEHYRICGKLAPQLHRLVEVG